MDRDVPKPHQTTSNINGGWASPEMALLTQPKSSKLEIPSIDQLAANMGLATSATFATTRQIILVARRRSPSESTLEVPGSFDADRLPIQLPLLLRRHAEVLQRRSDHIHLKSRLFEHALR